MSAVKPLTTGASKFNLDLAVILDGMLRVWGRHFAVKTTNVPHLLGGGYTPFCGQILVFAKEVHPLMSERCYLVLLKVRDSKPPRSGTEAAERHDIMERVFKIGCRVIFFDSYRKEHEALVTNWFHGGSDGQTVAEAQKGYEGAFYMPCCNIVWVVSDPNKEDPYGRQLERATSVTYGRQQGMTPFLGMCWCWPDEVEEARELIAKAFAEAVTRK